MSTVRNVIEYPDEGFAILEDDQGRYLAFSDNDKIEELPDLPSIEDDLLSWPTMKLKSLM